MKKKKLVWGIAIGAIVLVLAVMLIITVILMKNNFPRGDYPDKSTTYRYDHYEPDYAREEFEFESGDNTLKGFLYRADNTDEEKYKSGCLLVFAHGIGCGHEMYLSTVINFVDRGFDVLTYDATGSGYSEGEDCNGLVQSALDLDNALKYVENNEELSSRKIYLMGHSWGGYAVTAVLNFDHDVEAVVSLCGYDNAMEELMEGAYDIMGGVSKVFTPFAWVYNKLEFKENADLCASDGINKAGIPVLVVHGTEDEVISYDGAAIIAHKDKITNDKVEYITIDDEKLNKHNSILQSSLGVDYADSVNKDWEEYSKNMTTEEKEACFDEFVKDYDLDLVNERNKELYDDVEEFFDKYID